MDTSSSSAAPGWYPDPHMQGTQRYWDGHQWTDAVAPAAPVRDDDGIETAGWICAFLLPIVGFVLAIVLLARGNNKGVAILVVSVIVMVVIYQIIVSNQADTYGPY